MPYKFGDTPDLSASSLCRTCRQGKIIAGQKLAETITVCMDHPPMKVDFPVTSCSAYDDKRIPSLYEMQKIAYRFSVDDRKKTAGFVTPKEWKKKRDQDGDHEDLPLPPFLE